LGRDSPLKLRRVSIRELVVPDSGSKNVFSGIGNWKICPTFTIRVPIGLRSTGIMFTGGILVAVGVKDGVTGVVCGVGVMVVVSRCELDGRIVVNVKTEEDACVVVIAVEINVVLVRRGESSEEGKNLKVCEVEAAKEDGKLDSLIELSADRYGCCRNLYQ
jgi:hypothetical protein